ncbi:MAG: FKBP-type peptidyl-prolyl cis-trans isomerase [bacterium]|nr:FKBP-type peptidyl-prolyl cis-trans isomerase [bacterium]
MKIFLVIIVSVLMIAAAGCGGKVEEKPADQKLTLKTDKDKASYANGYNMGRYVKRDKDHLDIDVLIQGVRDGFNGPGKEQIPEAEMQKVLRDFQQKMGKARQEKQKIQGGKNIAEGEAFLKENATKEGVIVTKSGLQYKVLTEGTGPQPKATDQVEVHYKGTLIDGTDFDSSYKHGKPATFPLNRVIPGWTEGVQLMKVGAKYKFFLPSNIAYGKRGSGPVIGPNAVLVFEIELLSIGKAEEKKAVPAKKMPPKQVPAKKK